MTNKTILLVEDNPDDELLTLIAIKENNILNKVIVAHDGAEALEILFGENQPITSDPGRLPQIILLDLKLPKVDGIEVLQKIRAHPTTKLLPVIILTSSAEEMDILKSYQEGANSYIRKPVDFEQFTKAIKLLGLYWLVLNESLTIKNQ